MLWRTVAVALLAITAGCGTFATANEPTPTVTPVPVTDVPTEEPTPTGIAPGLRGGGVYDSNRLAAAHSEAIDGESYVWRSLYRVDSLPDASGYEHVVRENLRVESDRRYQFHTNRRDLDERGPERMLNNVSEFADGDTVYQRFIPFSAVDYRYRSQSAEPASVRYNVEMAGPIRNYLAVQNATVAEARVDGEPYYRVDAERERTPGITRGRNFSVTAFVSPEGFVRSLNVSYEIEESGRVSDVEYRFEYELRDDVSVEPPGWIDEEWSAETTESNRRVTGQAVKSRDR